MPIIIPSKNIYKKSHNKIADNHINRIDYTLYNYEEKKGNFEFPENVDTTDISSFLEQGVYPLEELNIVSKDSIVDAVLGYIVHIAVAGIKHIYKNIRFLVPRNLSSNEINEKPISVEYSSSVKECVRDAVTSLRYSSTDNKYDVIVRVGEKNLQEKEIYDFKAENSVTADSDIANSFPGGISVTTKTLENLSNYEIKSVPTEDGKYWIVEAKILCGAITLRSGAVTTLENLSLNPDASFDALYTILTEFRPQYINIKAFGTQITLNSTAVKQTLKLDDSAESVYSFPQTNLLQDSQKRDVEYNFNKLLQRYKDGLETVTILCSISDYYDENGNIVISKSQENRMVFENYDEVIPMGKNAYGEDVPISCFDDGGIKTFSVLGRNIYFDGACWQLLYCQEKGKFIEGTEGLVYNISPDGNYAILMGLSEEISERSDPIQVSSHYLGLPVKQIANGAFAYSFVSSVTIPQTVTIMGDNNGYAEIFYDCYHLTDIYVPWSEGEIIGAPWGAEYATIHYNNK